MIDPAALADAFDRNGWVVRAQTDGLTHEDSLVQTPYRINCLNWVLGHLLDGRGRVLELLGRDRVVPASETLRYVRESDPVLGEGPGVLRLSRLLEGIEASGAAISAALRALDTTAMAAEVDSGEGRWEPLGSLVHFQYFHDTYHAAQTDLLRQVAGVGDKVI